MKAAKKITVDTAPEQVRGESFERGVAELRRWVEVSVTTPEILTEAQRILEAMPESTVQQLIALGMQHLRERLDLTKVENNFRHVEEQLLRPVLEDADYLANFFGIDPVRLRLLVVLHDLGKVEIPGDLWTVLKDLFPSDFEAREILTHEYASMHWIAKLGETLQLPDAVIRALQALIANHNFGPDLCHERHRTLLDNWWPARFREKIMPKFRELGFPLERWYRKSKDGKLQYNHTEDNVYAALLSAYDRAIATKFNTYGLATWQKFAEQDYNTWMVRVAAEPSAPNPLRPSSLTTKMEQAALWAESEIKAMWRVLGERHVKPEHRGAFKVEAFPPCHKQIDGVQKLLRAIAAVKEANVTEAAGRLLYKTKAGELYRVDDRSHGVNPAEIKAKLFWWNNASATWQLIAEDRSPVKLYFEIVRGDL